MGMTSRQRLLIALVALAIVALMCGLFWPFIAAEIIAPIALLVWLLLRIFVLSIGQQYYWYGVIFVVLVFLFRLCPPSFNNPTFEKYTDINVAIKAFERWRSLFSLVDYDLHSIRNLRWELVRLLLSLYATKQHSDADFRLHETLQRREIVLPDAIHAFLFSDERPSIQRSFLQRAQDFCLFPLKWAWRRPRQRQEIAEYRRRIDEVLGFMEKSLEMNDDDGRTKHNGY
jgi:hypothetical protein